LTKEIFEIVVRINRERGTTILLVEQNANMALNAADYGYVLENGRIVMEDSCAHLARERRHQRVLPGHERSRCARPIAAGRKKKTWR
jgi:branched-chain amino acid transport system ATP-binding protein